MGFFDIIEQSSGDQVDVQKAAPEIIGTEPESNQPAEHPQKPSTGKVLEAKSELQPAPTSKQDLHSEGDSSSQTPPNDPTVIQHEHFTAAWPWIKNNIQQLLDEGWTRAALLRRSKYRWPCGPWGLAWLSAWSKMDVSVTIGRRGSVIFTYTSFERRITQSAQPPIGKKRIPTHKQGKNH